MFSFQEAAAGVFVIAAAATSTSPVLFFVAVVAV